MSADRTPASVRVLGNRAGLRDVEIDPWRPLSPAQAAARPPLPVPPERPRLPVAHGRGATAHESPASAAAAAPAATQPPPQPPPSPRPAWIEDDSVHALVWEQPGDTARVLQALVVRAETGDPNAELPPLQRAAILCVALRDELFGEVMKYCSDYEIEELTRSVATLRAVSAEMQQQVLDDLRLRLQARDWIDMGGMDYARRALERAVGPRKTKEFLARVAATVTTGFALLRDARPEELTPFISHEHPQTIALLLSQLQPALGSGVLELLPTRLQVEVSRRIATMQEVTPSALKELEEAMAAQLRNVVGGAQRVGGARVLAHLLNMSGPLTERAVLNGLDDDDDELGDTVRNQMFTYDDIGRMAAVDIKTLMDELEDEPLAIALKATREPMKDQIGSLVGQERWRQLAATMEQLGPMRASQVEEVQLRIVQKVRQLEEQGRVTIVRGPDDNPLV